MRLFAALLVMLAGCGCVSLPIAGHEAALRVEFDGGLCSATAVGPSTLLIATHCLEEGGAIKTVDKREVTVLSRVDDGRDHSLVRLNIGFDHWAGFGGAPIQGLQVHYYGNPLGLADMLREGYVAACMADGCLLDIEGAPGDSGAAVLDSRGRVVGVVSQILQGNGVQFRMMVLFPMAFTKAQLAAIA